jgi:hypothetical protein
MIILSRPLADEFSSSGFYHGVIAVWSMDSGVDQELRLMQTYVGTQRERERERERQREREREIMARNQWQS